MDATNILILRAAATTVWTFATILNGIVLYLVFYRTPKEYRNFSILLGTCSGASILSGTIGWAVIHQNEAAVNQTYPVVSYGTCNYVGPRFCFNIDQLCYCLICFEIFFTPFCMGYRLYVFMFRQLSTKGLVLLLIILASPWTYILYYRLIWYVEPFQIASSVSAVGKQYTFYGYYQPDTWQFEFMNALGFSPHVACALTLILRQVLIYKINKVSLQISGRGNGLHRIFAWMLTVQGTVPLATALATTITYMVRVDSSTSPLLGTFSYVIMALAPILEALVVLFCLPPYRRSLMDLIGIGNKSSTTANSAAPAGTIVTVA